MSCGLAARPLGLLSMDLINDFSEFFSRFYIVITSLALLSIFPILFFWKIVKPTLNNKRKYSRIAQKIYYDTDVYFKRFDIFNAKTYFNPFKFDSYSIMFNNTYEFYRADILVLETSIIIFSKHNILGFKFNWFSFRINFKDNNLFSDHSILSVKCISSNLKSNNLEIEFKDFNYKKSIVLGIKKIGLDIQETFKENIAKS